MPRSRRPSHEPAVEVEPARLDRPGAGGLHPRPGDREPVRVDAQLGQQVEVLRPAVVVVAGHVTGLAVDHPARRVAERVPDRRAAPVLGRPHPRSGTPRSRRPTRTSAGKRPSRAGSLPRVHVIDTRRYRARHRIGTADAYICAHDRIADPGRHPAAASRAATAATRILVAGDRRTRSRPPNGCATWSSPRRWAHACTPPSPGSTSTSSTPHCDHLLVREDRSGEIVGTYRMLPPHRAAAAGRLYSDDEFDLTAPGRRCATSSSRPAARACTRTTAAAPSSISCGRASPATCTCTATAGSPAAPRSRSPTAATPPTRCGRSSATKHLVAAPAAGHPAASVPVGHRPTQPGRPARRDAAAAARLPAAGRLGLRRAGARPRLRRGRLLRPALAGPGRPALPAPLPGRAEPATVARREQRPWRPRSDRRPSCGRGCLPRAGYATRGRAGRCDRCACSRWCSSCSPASAWRWPLPVLRPRARRAGARAGSARCCARPGSGCVVTGDAPARGAPGDRAARWSRPTTSPGWTFRPCSRSSRCACWPRATCGGWPVIGLLAARGRHALHRPACGCAGCPATVAEIAGALRGGRERARLPRGHHAGAGATQGRFYPATVPGRDRRRRAGATGGAAVPPGRRYADHGGRVRRRRHPARLGAAHRRHPRARRRGRGRPDRARPRRRPAAHGRRPRRSSPAAHGHASTRAADRRCARRRSHRPEPRQLGPSCRRPAVRSGRDRRRSPPTTTPHRMRARRRGRGRRGLRRAARHAGAGPGLPHRLRADRGHRTPHRCSCSPPDRPPTLVVPQAGAPGRREGDRRAGR